MKTSGVFLAVISSCVVDAVDADTARGSVRFNVKERVEVAGGSVVTAFTALAFVSFIILGWHPWSC